MILSGSQLVIGITGMHYVAATIILPFGVILYTVVGGLKATFLTDYLHTTIALILIMFFTISVLVNEHIGGLSGLYDKLQATAHLHPIPGNYQGSLLTIKSPDAVMWGLTLKFGNLALVVMDTAFWQKSFASKPSATVPGYLLTAVSIFAIPLGLGTVVGLAGRVIESTPLSPTYPNTFSADAVNRGYVMPYVVKGLLGKGATGGILLLLFMALTSTVSSSLIAVSSILSYDGYRTYINPKASDKTMIRVSHLTVVLYGAFIAGYTILLNYVGANMTFYGYLQPVVSCPGIFPLIFAIFSDRQSKPAAVLSPILGLLCGVLTWVYTARSIYGGISMEDTSNPAPGLYGSIVSLFSPIFFSIIISILRPSKFDWNEYLKIKLLDDVDSQTVAISDNTSVDQERKNSVQENSKEAIYTEHSSIDDEEKTTGNRGLNKVANYFRTKDSDYTNLEDIYDQETIREMRRWLKIAAVALVVIVLVTFVAWPMPLYRNYVFTKPFFSGWVTVAIIWQFQAFFTVAVYPLWDGRKSIQLALRGIKQQFRFKRSQESHSTEEN
ncbi:Dur3p [Sugiyamaella lignohabitans]|uniref:Dur3p n=1 Tax=Sugiyamaella lignohabitans TaxID=796027 RepID=A0A167CJJ8_9ASCO|nr:Dur3p [Sugiyamaella lignohabitans]ANB11783.1 Dur3p [Sugiyamaella lignohabitans]